MTSNYKTNVLVVLEALFHGVDVLLWERYFSFGVDEDNEPCITTMVTAEDDNGLNIDSECSIGADLGIIEFIDECSKLDDSYVTELAHRTALVKVSRKTLEK